MPSRPRPRFFAFVAPLIALAAIAVVVAGCGSNDDSSTSGSSGSAASSSSAGGAYGGSAATQSTTPAARSGTAGGAAASVKTARTPLGTILVDGSGRTLYLWEADTGMRSTCSGPCAQGWPPLTTKGRAAVSSGAQASQLGTTMRDDGTTQVTYAGHPLYTYSGDSAPGDTTGQDSSAFGADWYVVAPTGKAVE